MMGELLVKNLSNNESVLVDIFSFSFNHNFAHFNWVVKNHNLFTGEL